MKKHYMTTGYLTYEQRLEQLAAALNKTMDTVFSEMIAHFEAQLSDTTRLVRKPESEQTEWLQVGNGEPFGPYNGVKLRGTGPSFSEMIVQDRNQT